MTFLKRKLFSLWFFTSSYHFGEMSQTGTSKIRLGIWVPTGEGHGYPLQDSCLENPHGQRRLAGYSPWGHPESGTE